ncbi:hypothetical protein KGF54_005633 [Candida jiufengensis]|uniref:uncharacterized protein n=1 Tax=Candida jiufengensis TaxID=497108 RepID=UPI002224CC66|nr:uncharacterized protein KGF54_005633 [Candida jiufengensis]KAI5949398.1 hypothetical protein KGF54_005633 [Candida jiufengensis]
MLDIIRFQQYLSNDKYLNESLLSEKEFNLTSLTPNTLLLKLSKGSITSLELTTAFIKKYMIINNLITMDPIIKTHITNALAQARFLDCYYKATNSLMGPLHGLPINDDQLLQFQINYGIDDEEIDSLGHIRLNMATYLNLLGNDDIFSNDSYSKNYTHSSSSSSLSSLNSSSLISSRSSSNDTTPLMSPGIKSINYD